jgi:hypothetical protein
MWYTEGEIGLPRFLNVPVKHFDKEAIWTKSIKPILGRIGKSLEHIVYF